jgi:hypothetical protein
LTYSGPVSATEERVGRNEALFREVNERIRDVSGTLESLGGSSAVEFVCECSRTECHASVELELADYERIREHPARFLVAIGHLWSPDTERLVEEHGSFWVVEKVGDAAETAEEADPRS